MTDPIGEASTLGALLEDLYRLLESRRSERPEGSYTATLFAEGDEAILRKISEEAAEVLMATKDLASAATRDGESAAREQLVWEASDLLFHLLVLLVAQGITLDDIREELARRHVSAGREPVDDATR